MDGLDYSVSETLSDEELVTASHSGERVADEVLCTRYKDLVRRIAHPYFLIGADRDDILQEGMIGLYKAIRDFDSSGAFRPFAAMCVRRQIITAIKASNRNKHKPLNSSVSLQSPMFDGESGSLIDVVPLTADDPEDAFITKESIRAITAGIDEVLSPMEKQTLSLYLEGLSYSEIAARIGRSPKAVDNALQRVKHKLSAHLADSEEQ